MRIVAVALLLPACSSAFTLAGSPPVPVWAALRTNRLAMTAEPPPESEPPAVSPVDEPANERETVEEAWNKAPEGSFLSPALVAGLVLTGIAVKVTVFGGGSPVSFD